MKGAVCVALACVLVLVESMVVKREDACATMHQCIVKLKVNEEMKVDKSVEDFISDVKMLDQFCEDAETAKKCVNDRISGCESEYTVEDTKSTLIWAAYLCSGAGREEIMVLSRSECAHNLVKVQEMGIAGSACSNTFANKVADVVKETGETQEDYKSELCSLTRELNECLISAGSSHCGDEYGQYLRKYLTTEKGSALAQMDCPSQVTQKRQLPQIALSLVRISRSVDAHSMWKTFIQK